MLDVSSVIFGSIETKYLDFVRDAFKDANLLEFYLRLPCKAKPCSAVMFRESRWKSFFLLELVEWPFCILNVMTLFHFPYIFCLDFLYSSLPNERKMFVSKWATAAKNAALGDGMT